MDDKVTKADAGNAVIGMCGTTIDTVAHVQGFNYQELNCSKTVDEDSNQVTDHGNIEETKQGSANSCGISFHVDNSQIVPVATIEQASELQDLGLTVFNQEDYEQGIVAKVSAALDLEESERMKTVLQKRLASVEEGIRCTEQEIGHVDKVLSMLIQQKDPQTALQMQQVRRQQQSKLNQMKKLTATKKAIVGKMMGSTAVIPEDDEETDDNIVLEEALGLPHFQETESERLIRLGEMTPFGTIMTPDGSHVINPQHPDVISDFDKYLLGQSQLSNGSKKARKHQHSDTNAKNNSCKRKKMAVKNENRSGNDHETVKKCLDSVTTYGSMDADIKQEDVDQRQMTENLSNDITTNYDDSVINKSPTHSQHMSKEVKPHKQYKKPKKRDSLARDDGDIRLFQARMKAFQKQELEKKHAMLLDGQENSSLSFVELGGGFNIPTTVWNQLYKYQKTGVSWLWELHRQQTGGIIGDEMGLGKTIQMITFLIGLATSGLQDTAVISKYKGLGPVLVICPATVMHQWVKEFHTWWPPFCVAVLHSSGSHTSSPGQLVRRVVQCCGVIITSYSTLVLQQDNLLQHDWHYVVLDEGHKIRNPDAQITLACKQFRTPHRIILSGSPIQNNLRELWSLFDFVFPGKLGTLPDFMQHFSVPIVQGGYANSTDVQVQTAYKCACVLRDCINPYLLRRMKVDVLSAIQLPDKNEQVLFCRITQQQREVYQQYLDSKECHLILSGKYLVFPGLTTMRKICNHPDLSTGGPRVFGYPGEGELGKDMEYGYWKRSGKMIVIESLLKIWKKQQHKVLLFTQSRQMLEILEKFVQKQEYKFLKMDGTTAISSRQHLITEFNSDPEIFVFLLTTKVGGLGVNLTGADRVIIFDPDWNPSTDVQARERAWRIGQHRHVTIFRLLTTGTIEEKIYHRQIFKQFLTNRVLKDPKQRRFFKSNDLYELFTLGDDDVKQGTETSAIFAGTGSAISVKPKSKHKSDRQKKTCHRDMETKRNDDDLCLDNDKMRKMKDLAKKLSEQIKRGRSCSQLDKPSNGAVRCQSSRTLQSSDSPQESVLAATKNLLWLNSEKQVRQNSGSGESGSHSLKSRKKTKKHRRKDAVFEGSTVPHLVGLDNYRKNSDGGRHAEKDESYVLQKLLRKTGLHSAMQHDKIMMSSSPDFVLVENEAQTVARQASLALKQSRRRINSRPGVPTWTGQHGVAGAPRVTCRFGQKKNSKLLAVASAATSCSHADQVTPAVSPTLNCPIMPHFDGSVVGTMTSSDVDNIRPVSTATTMSSEELLTKMRLRNETGLAGVTEEECATVMGPSTAYMDLITDIRNVVAFGCSTEGQATTHELLDQFASRLPSDNSAKFRAMLRQICTFERCRGIGLWRLKPQFR